MTSPIQYIRCNECIADVSKPFAKLVNNFNVHLFCSSKCLTVALVKLQILGKDFEDFFATPLTIVVGEPYPYNMRSPLQRSPKMVNLSDLGDSDDEGYIQLKALGEHRNGN